MVTFHSRTRRQLRAHILRGIGGLYEGTNSETATTGTIKDNSLNLGATDDHKGKYVYFTATANANVIRRLTASSVTTGVTTLTFLPVVGTAPVANDTYQLIGWPGYAPHPDQIHDAMNQAVMEVAGLYFVPIENLSLHGDGIQARFDLPTTIHMINQLQYRWDVVSTVIDAADGEWDEAAAPTFVTRSVDTEIKREGSGANKFGIGASFTTGIVSSKAISSLDLSKYDYVEFWVRSTAATVAGDFELVLDNTAASVSPLETLTIPALAADTWTYVRVALGNPELDTAIISVGLNAANNIAATTVWIDDVKAVQNDSAVWRDVEPRLWRVDQPNRDLVLRDSARSQVGSRLLKLVGGARPALFADDDDVSEVPDDFIIARATSLLLYSGVCNPSLDVEQRKALASHWGRVAERAKSGYGLPANTRFI